MTSTQCKICGKTESIQEGGWKEISWCDCPKGDNWIKVGSRMPTKEESECVLIYDLEEGVHEAEYLRGDFNYPYYGQEMSGLFKNVIAWQPMIKPPKNIK